MDQIHDLSDGFELLVKARARKVGEFYALENSGQDIAGNYYRVRLILDVRKQLKKHVFVIHL